MSPWGCQVEDHRFGMLLSIIGNALGGEWIKPENWFTRYSSHEEEVKSQKAAQLSNVVLARFKIYSAEQQALKQKERESKK
ncbi:hypothetical protein K7H13_13740 [Qipengyuania citrea]|uniref:hypothetical protein n=1 Tax=Qipengyuania citrea TaxID=225971 RepID=UPI001E57CD3F|nr:hypothetical protein [Qipengyuania citrea]MCD1591811.1 hypothetical protein [Qipengyuania citrea]